MLLVAFVHTLEDWAFLCIRWANDAGQKESSGRPSRKGNPHLEGGPNVNSKWRQQTAKELILQAISNLEVEGEEKLRKLANVVSVMSVNHERSKFETRQLYCEDTRLSIGYAGTPYLALAVDRGSVPEQ